MRHREARIRETTQDLEDKQSAIEEIQRNYDRNIEKIQELIKTVEQMK